VVRLRMEEEKREVMRKKGGLRGERIWIEDDLTYDWFWYKKEGRLKDRGGRRWRHKEKMRAESGEEEGRCRGEEKGECEEEGKGRGKE